MRGRQARKSNRAEKTFFPLSKGTSATERTPAAHTLRGVGTMSSEDRISCTRKALGGSFGRARTACKESETEIFLIPSISHPEHLSFVLQMWLYQHPTTHSPVHPASNEQQHERNTHLWVARHCGRLWLQRSPARRSLCVYRTLRRERRCGVEAWQECSALHSSTDQERRRQDIRVFPSAVVAGPLDALFENLRDVRVAQQSCLYETGEREGADANQ